MITKRCSRCKKNKSLDDFHNGNGKYKKHNNCKSCGFEYNQIRLMNPKLKKQKADNHTRYIREWRKDPHNRAASNIRSRNSNLLSRLINNFDNVREETVQNLHGIGKQDYMNHLESLFEKGMSWNNYGAWHLDHEINLSEFNLLDPKVAKKANHYTNIRPMWATGEKGNLTRKKSPRIYNL